MKSWVTDMEMSYLSRAERISLALRSLYAAFGYEKYKMSRFEPYDFYAENRSFVAGDNILTFTDTNGRLMAMKPDVTMSIVKNYRGGEVRAVYNESVYRDEGDLGEFREIMQIGVERIGTIDFAAEEEVLRLAKLSLAELGEGYILDIGSPSLVLGLMEATDAPESAKKALLAAVNGKNAGLCGALCEKYALPDSVGAAWKTLCEVYGGAGDVIPALASIALNDKMESAAAELSEIAGSLGGVNVDFSIVTDLRYYNGVVFKGYLRGSHAPVLSGGRYDNLVHSLGKSAGAIGFAVYLESLGVESGESGAIRVALPKGRLGERVYELFESSGFGCPEMREKSRRLIFENESAGVSFFWAKPSDVPIYVERGAADIGVAGSDILEEYRPDVYELLDLGLGKCRMCVAAPESFKDDTSRPLRVATKFPNIARRYYSDLSREIDIIHLTGSIELAPIVGLSDVIVDIVETGGTLRENGLKPFETITDISARLIANRASYKFRTSAVLKLKKAVEAALSEG